MLYIRQHERGLVFEHDAYVGFLKSGRSWQALRKDRSVVVWDMREPFKILRGAELYRADPELMKEMELLDVGDGEIALHSVDGHFKQVLGPGLYGFWKGVVKHDLKVLDLNKPESAGEIGPALFKEVAVSKYVQMFRVADHEKGLLFYDGVFQRLLEPGVYRYLRGPVEIVVRTVDVRKQQLSMTGQEVMTRDRVSLRLNFTVHYSVKDPVKAVLNVKGYEEQLYVLMQMALREYVGELNLDELLGRKEDVNEFVLQRLREQSDELGLDFRFAGVKDVVLPGDIREILNLVLIAERKAQANIVTRREETASTRSLLNTARLMDENPTLYRLKELEFLERVADKIGTVSLMGGNGGLLEQVSTLLARAEKK